MAIHIEADPQTQTAKSAGIAGNSLKHVNTLARMFEKTHQTTIKAIFDFNC